MLKPQSVHGAETVETSQLSHICLPCTLSCQTPRACLVSTVVCAQKQAHHLQWPAYSPVHRPAASSAAQLCSLQQLLLARPTLTGAAVSDPWQPAHGLQLLCAVHLSLGHSSQIVHVFSSIVHCYSCMPQTLTQAAHGGYCRTWRESFRHWTAGRACCKSSDRMGSLRTSGAPCPSRGCCRKLLAMSTTICRALSGELWSMPCMAHIPACSWVSMTGADPRQAGAWAGSPCIVPTTGR